MVAGPTDGLGCDLDFVEQMVRDDPEALRMLREALAMKPGRPAKTDSNRSDFRGQPEGTTRAYTLDRLHRETPDLYQPLRLPRDLRKELVGYLAGEGMSSRSIAPIVGATDRQVRRDISGGTNVPPEMQGAPTPCPAPTVDRTTGEVADTGTDWPVVAGPFHWPLTGHKPKHVADIPASKPHNFHRDTVPKVHHGGMSR